MNVYQKPNPWNKRRFDWKRDLNRSPDLSNGAKRFGAVLCDQYVRRENGQCWPANKTLANAMALHVRSVQRYIKELMIHGWLQQVHIPRRRRGLQITWPRQAKDDTKHDMKGDIHQSRLSPESDSTVAPYIEPSKNQVKKATLIGVSSWHQVGETEVHSIAEWSAYLATIGHEDVDAVLKLVKVGNAYRLPCRYPKSIEKDQTGYKRFFADVLASNGKNVQ
jgi:hypothetical protein